MFESLTEFYVINCFHKDSHKDSHGHAFQLLLTGQVELKLDDNLFILGTIFVKWRHLSLFSFIRKSRTIYAVVTNESNIISYIYAAASFSSLGPMLSVPVALLTSIFVRYFNTFSFPMFVILNSVFSDNLL